MVDNGSSDHSAQVASQAGARVIRQPVRGYGAALRKGLSAARGTVIIMADADLSYDIQDASLVLQALNRGAAVAVGNRFRGQLAPGAMPWLHRYVGNPVLTWLANLLFQTHLGDYHSGLRGLQRRVVRRLDLRATGMEFASEMIVKASLLGLPLVEVPIRYRKDGRGRPSHLRSFRDGWRHLKFLLSFAPNWVFFYPAVVTITGSALLLGAMIFQSLQVGQVAFGIHTMLVIGGLLIIGYQLFHWSLCTYFFARQLRMPLPTTRWVQAVVAWPVERLLSLGGLSVLVGWLLALSVLWQWQQTGFGNLDPEQTLRRFIPGVVLMVLGVQVIFSALFLELLKQTVPSEGAKELPVEITPR